jgi:hypothetical protein
MNTISTLNGYKTASKIAQVGGRNGAAHKRHTTSTMSNGLKTMSKDALNRTAQSLNKSSASNKSFKLPSYATCL